MGKSISKILGLSGLIVIISVISYISLLGENDRAATTVKMYFENIAKQRYEANRQLCSDAYNHQFDNINDPITHQFSLETALLNAFGLINTAQYTIQTQRSEFWFPYLSKNTLHVSIRIHPQKSGNILTGFIENDTKPFVKDIVTLIREDGRWKIMDIDTRTSVIAKDYQDTKNSMQNSQYIQQTADGLTIKENTLQFSSLDPIRKRIITFNLNKALLLLNNHK